MPITSCFVSFARLASRAAAARSARVSRVRIERVLTARVKRFQLRPAAPNGTRSSSSASFFDDRLGGFRVRENLSRSRSADLLACNDSPRARAAPRLSSLACSGGSADPTTNKSRLALVLLVKATMTAATMTADSVEIPHENRQQCKSPDHGADFLGLLLPLALCSVALPGVSQSRSRRNHWSIDDRFNRVIRTDRPGTLLAHRPLVAPNTMPLDIRLVQAGSLEVIIVIVAT